MKLKLLPDPQAFDQIRGWMLSKWLTGSTNPGVTVSLFEHSGKEGVSTIVTGIGRSFGTTYAGKTLLLDAATGPKNLAYQLSLPQKVVKIEDIENDITNFGDYIVTHKQLGVDLLTLDDSSISVSGSQNRARAFLTGALKYYDLILVDAGALSENRSIHWLSASDYRVLVVDATRTTREALKHQKSEIAQRGIEIDGSVLNKRSYHIPKSLYWLVR